MATLSNFDDHLILASGTGSFTFGGNIGDTLALTSLSINATSGSGTADFTVPQLGGGGSVGVTGAVNLGNASGGHITFSGSGAPLPLKVICPPEALPKFTAPVTPTDPPPPSWGTVKSAVPDPEVALILKEVSARVSPIFPPKVKDPVPEARIK